MPMSQTAMTGAQAFGETVRASATVGIAYDSLRHRGGTNVVGYQVAGIIDVVQTDHFEINIEAASRRIDVRKLSG